MLAKVADLTLSSCAEALRYPTLGRHARLSAEVCCLPAGRLRDGLLTFLAQVGQLSLEAWEELYTRTWDLEPLTPPYVGFHIWGEDYRRGSFLAVMRGACRAAEIDLEGELPDHLVPVLRCMAAGHTPAELAAVWSRALQKMAAQLRERDEHNPYLGLIEALEGQK